MRFLMQAGVLASLMTLIPTHPAPAQEVVWQPPELSARGNDVVQLSSDRSLRGKLTGMLDDRFDFDSGASGLATYTWSDVVTFTSPRALTYAFRNGATARGPAAMREGVLRIRSGGVILQFARADLQSITAPVFTELDYWSLKAHAGLVGRSGNTDQTDANAQLVLRRETGLSRLNLGYEGNLGEVSGMQNVNNHRADATLKIFATKGLFLTPGSVSYYADRFQNIDYRYTLGAGVGYFVIRRSDLEFYFELGGGFQSTRYLSVGAGEDDVESSASITPSTSVEWELADNMDLAIVYGAQIGVPDTRTTLHNLTTRYAIRIYGALDLTLSLTWDRVENPKSRSDGTMPKRDDFRTSLGIGVSI